MNNEQLKPICVSHNGWNNKNEHLWINKNNKNEHLKTIKNYQYGCNPARSFNNRNRIQIEYQC